MFSKLNLHVPDMTVKRIVLNAAGAVEPILHVLREKIQKKVDHGGENTVGCPVCAHEWTDGKICAFSVILSVRNNHVLKLLSSKPGFGILRHPGAGEICRYSQFCYFTQVSHH